MSHMRKVPLKWSSLGSQWQDLVAQLHPAGACNVVNFRKLEHFEVDVDIVY